MILFLDTEFTGIDQPNPSLISLALVDESGDRTFYAELPSDVYIRQTSDWVHQTVIPLLWGGECELPPLEFKAKLLVFIESIEDRVMIVTSSPYYDFDLMLKPMLDRWPQNLAKEPLRFDAYAMGENRRAWLSRLMSEYHTAARPEHHALHDAHALRVGFMTALERGWRPALRMTSGEMK